MSCALMFDSSKIFAGSGCDCSIACSMVALDYLYDSKLLYMRECQSKSQECKESDYRGSSSCEVWLVRYLDDMGGASFEHESHARHHGRNIQCTRHITALFHDPVHYSSSLY